MKFEDLFENEHNQFDFKPSDTCAIVGNGGILIDSGYGNFIDGHDCVIRMNAAPTEGYEEDVGSKETMRILNGPLARGETPDQTHTRNNWVYDVEDSNIIIGRTPNWSIKKALMILSNKNNVYLPSKNILKKINKWEKSRGMELGSTGFLTIQLFSTFFNSLNIFGFGFHQEKIQIRHYWESYKSEHEVNHQWKKEKQWVHTWQNENKLNIYK